LKTISENILSTPINGRNFSQGITFGEFIQKPKFVVFLRHFGCIFCRENIKDLKKASKTVDSFPEVVFIHQGTVEEGNTFFKKFWEEAPAISDPSKTFYSEFGVERGSFSELLSPSVVACSFRAMGKGNFVGKPIGDPLVMPGMFYVEGNSIVWTHNFKHIGDHPDYETLPKSLNKFAIAQ